MNKRRWFSLALYEYTMLCEGMYWCGRQLNGLGFEMGDYIGICTLGQQGKHWFQSLTQDNAPENEMDVKKARNVHA